MADDERLIEKTKRFFYQHQTLFSDTEEEVEVKASNKFLQFLDQDDRNLLLESIKNKDTSAL